MISTFESHRERSLIIIIIIIIITVRVNPVRTVRAAVVTRPNQTVSYASHFQRGSRRERVSRKFTKPNWTSEKFF